MTTINSVLGPINSSSLGFTLAHEHLMVGAPGFFRDYPELFGRNARARIIADLKQAKEAGIKTIVDATTFDLGRDINLLREASLESGVNIIATTGWWVNVPPLVAELPVDRLAGMFIREIEEGIAGTGIKAGVLKSASDMYGVIPENEAVLRAVARAHLRTGAPIALHSFPTGQVGRQQLKVLREEGVDLNRVKLDHSNDTTDVSYLIWCLEQGVYLGLDRYPGQTVSALERTITMKALIDAGYADRLCPSHDWLVCTMQTQSPEIEEAQKKLINPHGLLFINNEVIPRLRELGVPEQTLGGLCVNGPRNFFGGG